MNLQKIRDWLDLVLKVLLIAAIMGFGSWLYYQYGLAETETSNIQLSVTTEVLKYANDNKLLLIHLKPKNVGKELLLPQHMIVTVNDVPGNLNPGAIDIEQLKARSTTDVIDRYKEGFSMEPDIGYDEVVAVIVPNGIYAVRGVINSDDYEIKRTTLVKVE